MAGWAAWRSAGPPSSAARCVDTRGDLTPQPHRHFTSSIPPLLKGNACSRICVSANSERFVSTGLVLSVRYAEDDLSTQATGRRAVRQGLGKQSSASVRRGTLRCIPAWPPSGVDNVQLPLLMARAATEPCAPCGATWRLGPDAVAALTAARDPDAAGADERRSRRFAGRRAAYRRISSRSSRADWTPALAKAHPPGLPTRSCSCRRSEQGRGHLTTGTSTGTPTAAADAPAATARRMSRKPSSVMSRDSGAPYGIDDYAGDRAHA